jgi:hypothetical protein
MPLKLKKPAQATAQVQKQEKHKSQVISEQNTEEKVELPAEAAANSASAEPWCEVGVEASYTMNLGDFNSTRLQVSLKVPCLHAEINDVFEFSKDWVDSKMQVLIGEVESQK